ncbi:hypothetical protein MLD38_004955 [Melastoma candidum]|uniref:Uncharacterized protein n=1 Tax=Melastoma candidum TaxID=119954 RepID=A0ACB9SFY5_9MYRT|nr:hypothetical protein MLD38_004955 [Melastoma candidum]
MEWWRKMIYPVKRAWIAVSSRFFRSTKTGDGLLKLHDHVQTCEYQDVQVMWEMLRRPGPEPITANPDPNTRKPRPPWRILVWTNRGNRAGAPSSSEDPRMLTPCI